MRLRKIPALLAGFLLCAIPLAASAAHVNVVTIDGFITPPAADYLLQMIARSEADGAQAVLIELDTPGGLLSSTKDIVQAMHLVEEAPDLELHFLMDSIAQLNLIEAHGERRSLARPLNALLEMGVAGGRTGCRDRISG